MPTPKPFQPESDLSPKTAPEFPPELLLQALMAHLPERIFFKDRHSRFVNGSQSLVDLFGVKDFSQVYGRTDADFFSAPHAAATREDEQEILRTGRARVSQEELETWPDGHTTWSSTSKAPLRDAQGRIIGIVGVGQDITARKLAEEQVRRLNGALEHQVRERTAQLEAANEELEAFSFSVSHDLRAPLRAIDGYTRMLVEDCGAGLDATARDYLARVGRSTQRMSQLIDDLLALAQVSRAGLDLQLLDLSAEAARILEELAQGDPARRCQTLVTPALRAAGDPHLLPIALANLLGNAWKYTGKRAEARIEFGSVLQDDRPVFFVRDNGTGFAMDQADQLFSPFHRLHSTQDYEGTGIGLAIVQRILRRHGGRVWAEAAPDQGATFFFSLPGMDTAIDKA